MHKVSLCPANPGFRSVKAKIVQPFSLSKQNFECTLPYSYFRRFLLLYFMYNAYLLKVSKSRKQIMNPEWVSFVFWKNQTHHNLLSRFTDLYLLKYVCIFISCYYAILAIYVYKKIIYTPTGISYLLTYLLAYCVW